MLPVYARFNIHDSEKTWDKTARNRSRSLIELGSPWHPCHVVGDVRSVNHIGDDDIRDPWRY
jgi:hypothetical protein